MTQRLTPEMLVDRIRVFEVDELHDWDRNPNQGDVGAIARSMGEFGQLDVLHLVERDGVGDTGGDRAAVGPGRFLNPLVADRHVDEAVGIALQIDDAVDALQSLMEPMIMVVLGTLIGGMVVAMYLPIFKMGQVV